MPFYEGELTSVDKSYIPKTGKFIKITDPGAKQQVQNAAARKITPKGRYGKPNEDHVASFRQLGDQVETTQAKAGVGRRQARIKAMGTPRKTAKVNGRTVKTYVGKTPRGVAGYALNEGGKRGTSHVMISEKGVKYNPESSLRTLQHEMAHATPRRSAWRMRQINSDKAKIGREEARADMAEGARWKSKANRSGYYDRARLPIRSKQTRAYREELMRRTTDVKKSFYPGELVAKMGPDASAVHVMRPLGATQKTRRKPQLKKVTQGMG